MNTLLRSLLEKRRARGGLAALLLLTVLSTGGPGLAAAGTETGSAQGAGAERKAYASYRSQKGRVWLARSQRDGDITILKLLIYHPMETGLRIDHRTGARVPADYIDRLTIKVNGKTAVASQLGPAVSKNPFFQFFLPGAPPGATLQLHWVDNQGGSFTEEFVLR